MSSATNSVILAPRPRLVEISDAHRDWLANLIRVSKLLVHSGDVIPAPYIKSATAVVLSILEAMQLMHENQQEFKELSHCIADTLNLLINESGQAELVPLTKFKNIIANLLEQLLRISAEASKVDQSTMLTRYWRKESIKEKIARSRAQIDEARNDMLVVQYSEGQISLEDVYRLLCSSQVLRFLKPHDERNDFHRFTPGDLEVIRHWLSPEDIVNPRIRDSIVRTQKRKKRNTARIYGDHESLELWKADVLLHSRLRHPLVLQLFGVCDSRERPALIFHEDLRNLNDYEWQVEDFYHENVIFGYQVMQDYKEAHKYLRNFMDDCLVEEDLDLYYSGCCCLDDHTFRCETLVNGHGRLCIYLSSNLKPWMPDRPHVRTWCYIHKELPPPSIIAEFRSILDMVKRGIPIAVPPLDTIKVYLAAFHNLVVSLNFRSTYFATRLEVPVGDLCGTERFYYGASVTQPQFLQDGAAHVIGRVSFPTEPLPITDKEKSDWHVEPSVRRDILPELKNMNGRTRFTLIAGEDVGNVIYLSSCRICDEQRVAHSWISQERYIRSKIPAYALGRDPSLILTTEAQCELRFKPRFSQHPDFDVLYLFVDNFVLDESGIARRPQMFWSRDPEGNDVFNGITVDVLARLGLGLPRLLMRSWGMTWSKHHMIAVQQVHEACGFDPTSNEVARLLGLPLAEFQPPIVRLKRRRSAPFNLATQTPRFWKEEFENWHDIAVARKANIPKKRRRGSFSQGDEGRPEPGYDLIMHEWAF